MSVAQHKGATPPPAGVFCIGTGEAGTPSSNHGVKKFGPPESRRMARGEGSGLWDYLTITCPRSALVSRADAGTVVVDGESLVMPGQVEAYCHGADEDHSTARVLGPEIVDWLLPGHALTPTFFEPKGWQGYKQSAQLYAPGIATPVGLVAREGNHDTVCVSITGSGMFAIDLRRARLALEHYGARITRIDAAFDDLDGSRLDMEALRACARNGLFNASSKPSSLQYVDDLGTGSGCSLYVGRKGDKQLNVYEKGKQQGDKNSRWTRLEVRLWAKNRHLPLSMIDSPIGAILGAYPRLRAWLPDGSPTRAKTMRRQVEANAGAMTTWLQSAAGKSIGLMRDAARKAGATDTELLDFLSRDGMPARFDGVSDEVAVYRTAEFLQGAIP